MNEIRRGFSQADDAAYTRTHPLPGDRIQTLRGLLESDPAWDTEPDPQLQERFLAVRAKLYGYLAEPERTLRQYPADDQSVPALYARAYGYHKDAQVEAALGEADKLLATDPDNPYFLELKAQILHTRFRIGRSPFDLRQPRLKLTATSRCGCCRCRCGSLRKSHRMGMGRPWMEIEGI